MPVPVAALSKAEVCGSSASEIVGSNPAGCTDVCLLFCQVEFSATSWSLGQGSSADCGASLCTTYKRHEKKEVIARVGLQRHKKKKSLHINLDGLQNPSERCQARISSRFPAWIETSVPRFASPKLSCCINCISKLESKRLRRSRGSVLAFGTQVRGFKPNQSHRIFQGEKILSKHSFGGEVKPSVPCRRLTACKRSLNVMWKSGIFRQNSSVISRPCSSTFGC